MSKLQPPQEFPDRVKPVTTYDRIQHINELKTQVASLQASIKELEDDLKKRTVEIWMEGYAATGEHGTAQQIGSYIADSFDEAVQMYINENPSPEPGAEVRINTRSRYGSDEAYENRRSNYNIWSCNLFDNETDARVAFG